MRSAFILLAASLAPLLCAAQTAEAPANALILTSVGSGCSFAKLRGFLEADGGRIAHAFPPDAYIAFLPAGLENRVTARCGASVFRDRVPSSSVPADRGENVSVALAVWNGRFPAASREVPRADEGGTVARSDGGEDIVLAWEADGLARAYRLQVAADPGFAPVLLDTLLTKNDFEICPAFFPAGAYYWRVAARAAGDGESAFSETRSFTISKPRRMAARGAMQAPARPSDARVKNGSVSWRPDPALRRYRLQIAGTPDFSSPVVDAFTDGESYKLSGLPLARETTYYMRVMGSDGSAPGSWSGTSSIVLETPAPIPNDVRHPARRK